MEELAALLIVATPFVASAAIGLAFPRAWQRALFAGVGGATACAGYTYFAQRGMTERFAGSPLPVAEPMTSAFEAALVTFPIGICVGITAHLIASFVRNKEP
jgi:hypothetical protein